MPNGIETVPLILGLLTTSDVADSFEGFISAADEDVENFIAANSKADGELEMSASQSLELQ